MLLFKVAEINVVLMFVAVIILYLCKITLEWQITVMILNSQ